MYRVEILLNYEMKKILLILLVFSIALAGCNSAKKAPRGTAQTKKPASGARSGKSSDDANEQGTKRRTIRTRTSAGEVELPMLGYYDKFYDTTVIKLPTAYAQTGESIAGQFDRAYREYENENYQSSCDKFRTFAETFAKGDSLQFEALFLHSECLLLENKLSQAENVLLSLLPDAKLPKSILQKVLVRLGQVYCVMDKEKSAEMYFSRLRKEFPQSPYIKIADCSAVKK